ncbi:MAG: FkbM family methyltransferase [Sphingomonadales bacterium]
MATQKFYGQFGEDRILAGMFFGPEPQTCVDVGANDGITGSVSLFFEQQGWRCVLVEPNPDLCDLLRRERKSFLFEGAASGAAGVTTLMLAEGADLSHAVSSIEPGAKAGIEKQGLTVRAVDVRIETLDNILESAGISPGEIAFVSIDVEGHERAVLSGFSASRWRPRVFVIEDNSIFLGNGIRRDLESSGYVRFLRTGVNDWYAAKGDVEITGSNPERRYMASMVRARGLMLRRRASGFIVTMPILGPAFQRAVRAVRTQSHG